MKKKVKVKYFENAEELRRALVKKYATLPSAVIFVNKDALEQLEEQNEESGDKPFVLSVSDGIWEGWPRVEGVRRKSDGKMLCFEKTADGEKIFFFDVQEAKPEVDE